MGKRKRGARVLRQTGRVLPRQMDASGLGRFEADNHIEGCSLAGAVRAEKTHDLTWFDVEGDVINHPPPAVGFLQIESVQRERRRFFRSTRRLRLASLFCRFSWRRCYRLRQI